MTETLEQSKALTHPKQKNDIIKIIAMVTMFIDHLGVIFFPESLMLRVIGRIAFPIFAYGIAMGFHYTRDRKKYVLRLLMFSIISQIPYMWLNKHAAFEPYRINQIPQLLYAVGVLFVLEATLKSRGIKKIGLILLSLVLAFIPDVILSLNSQLNFGYGTYGVLMSMLFYVFRHDWLKITISYILLTLLGPYLSLVKGYAMAEGSNWFKSFINVKFNLESMRVALSIPGYSSYFILQAYSMLALPILYKSEMKPKSFKLNRWIVYWFYPVHIAALVIAFKILRG